jgi:hypothetical protein
MAEISNAAINRRAVELAAKDGFAWQLEFTPVQPRQPLQTRPVLDDAGRQKYRDRARAELEREIGQQRG